MNIWQDDYIFALFLNGMSEYTPVAESGCIEFHQIFFLNIAIKIEHMAPFKVGIIGTGRISAIYLKNCARFSELSMEVCASLNPSES